MNINYDIFDKKENITWSFLYNTDIKFFTAFTRRMILLSIVIVSLLQLLPSSQGFAIFTREGVHHIKVDEHGVAIDPHIMGGTLASAGQFPFQIAVYASRDPNVPQVFCGGTLISSTAVITAAHCVQGYNYFDVILGTLTPLNVNSPGRIQIKTTNMKIHENYNFDLGLDNDIAILILPYASTLSSTVQPILLPKRGDANQLFIQPSMTSGWGKIGDVPGFINENLLYVEVDVVHNDECVRAYGPHNVPLTKICISTAGGTEGPCHGDSGGPLSTFYNGETILTGIVSFGAKQGCQSGFPDVYTRISSFLDWIAANGGPAVRT